MAILSPLLLIYASLTTAVTHWKKLFWPVAVLGVAQKERASSTESMAAACFIVGPSFIELLVWYQNFLSSCKDFFEGRYVSNHDFSFFQNVIRIPRSSNPINIIHDPGVSGVRRIRSPARISRTPVIFLTS